MVKQESEKAYPRPLGERGSARRKSPQNRVPAQGRVARDGEAAGARRRKRIYGGENLLDFPNESMEDQE